MTAKAPLTTTAYQFGDNAQAAERLRILAEVFEPSTRDFLTTLVVRRPRTILDLGCGPGHTTRLLAEVFGGAEVLGVDNSPPFIELARQSPAERVQFSVAEVTRQLPGPASDLIYCRYLVTHLPQAREVIEQWADHLSLTGTIAIEENEWIRTTQPAFARYLEIVSAMLLDSGKRLYVGADLAADRSWSKLRAAHSDVVPIEACEGRAAAMFVLNIATWKTQPYVVEHFKREEIDELERNLTNLARVNSSERTITFGRRRMLLEPAG